MPANIPALLHLQTLSTTSTLPLTTTPQDTTLRQQLLDLELSTAALRDSHPAPPPSSTLSALKSQHESPTSSFIPSPTSPLPLLLAYRSLTKTISETNSTLPLLQERLKHAEEQLKLAKKDLADAKSLNQRLSEATPATDVAPDRTQLLREQLKAHKKKKREVMRGFREFLETLDPSFLDDNGAQEAEEDLPNGQRRITSMFGRGDGEAGEGERENDVQKLVRVVEELMNRAFEEGGDPWMSVEKGDERVVRFLVNCGVARGDGKDMGRVRLVEFGMGFE